MKKRSREDKGVLQAARELVTTLTKEDELDRFIRSTVRQFQARYSQDKITKWAMSAQSGMGRFWFSERHARMVVYYICKAISTVARRRLSGKAAWRRANHDWFFRAVAHTAKDKIEMSARLYARRFEEQRKKR